MGILQARIREWIAIPFSRVFFLTQGSNLGLLHCRQILNRLRNIESNRNQSRLKWLPSPVFLPGEFLGQKAWRAIVHGVTKSQTLLSN